MKLIVMNRTLWIAAPALLCAAMHAQSTSNLTARELFYTPVRSAQKAETPKVQPAADNRVTRVAKKPGQRPKESGANVAEPPLLDAKAGKSVQNAGPRPSQSGGSTEVPLLNASNVESVPLAIRYSVMKLMSDGEYQEVRPDQNFRSGDKLRIAVEANDAGYLYIIQRGSSKTWSVLFPNSEYEGGSNRITATRRQVIPGRARFTLDDTPGKERLFLVFARKPEPDLEKLIYTLSSGENAKPAAKPANTPAQLEPKKTMLAQAKFDDPFVDRLRSKLISRDLVFETVDDMVDEKKDTATYVATPDRSPNARVVADFTLQHN